VKRGLRKYSLKKGHHGDWDLAVAVDSYGLPVQ
jgi:hypothetical protein